MTKTTLQKQEGFLKDYQKIGIRKMLAVLWNAKHKGCILADDMGLGKTVQLMFVILDILRNQMNGDKKILIIVPKSIIQVWFNHFCAFAPAFSFITELPLIHLFKGDEDKFLLTKAKIILTTYGMVKRKPILLNQKYYLLILDEAHVCKNRETKLSKIIKAIKTNKKILVTGTPMENSFDDFRNLIDILLEKRGLFDEFEDNPNLWTDESFIKFYMKKRRLVIIRRTKKKVLNLPFIAQETILCPLTKHQKLVLKKLKLTPMKQIDYKIYFKREGRGGFARAWSTLKHSGLVDWYKETYEKKSKKASIEENIHKFGVCLELLRKKILLNEKAIIFSTSVITLKNYKKFLEKNGIQCLILTGEDSNKKRSESVDKFQKDGSQYNVFLISTKAGGTGLTLTSANNVIFHDPWWTHSARNQAISRVHRIGQKHTVFVYDLITQDSFEQSIFNYSLKWGEFFNKLFNMKLIFDEDPEDPAEEHLNLESRVKYQAKLDKNRDTKAADTLLLGDGKEEDDEEEDDEYY